MLELGKVSDFVELRMEMKRPVKRLLQTSRQARYAGSEESAHRDLANITQTSLTKVNEKISETFDSLKCNILYGFVKFESYKGG